MSSYWKYSIPVSQEFCRKDYVLVPLGQEDFNQALLSMFVNYLSFFILLPRYKIKLL